MQIAAITTLPFDVVKTRRQIELGEMEMLGGNGVTGNVFSQIHAEFRQNQLASCVYFIKFNRMFWGFSQLL